MLFYSVSYQHIVRTTGGSHRGAWVNIALDRISILGLTKDRFSKSHIVSNDKHPRNVPKQGTNVYHLFNVANEYCTNRNSLYYEAIREGVSHI